MDLGDVVRFTSDQAIGHALREKMHVFVGRTNDYRASAEYAFLFISKANHSDCFSIARDDYSGFLSYDSFLSCGGLVFYSHQYLLDAKVKRLGSIKREHLIALRNHLATHDIMEIWQCKLACNALSVLM
jgi:hypothetical protein